jgi:HSP20 family molecular chaperone IbpA
MGIFGDLFKPIDDIFDKDFLKGFDSLYHYTSWTDGKWMRSEEDEKQYIYSVELPGYKPEEVDLSVTDGRVSITATTKKGEKNQSFKYSFSLPASADTSTTEAKLDLGILKMTIKKSASEQPKSRKVVVK